MRQWGRAQKYRCRHSAFGTNNCRKEVCTCRGLPYVLSTSVALGWISTRNIGRIGLQMGILLLNCVALNSVLKRNDACPLKHGQSPLYFENTSEPQHGKLH